MPSGPVEKTERYEDAHYVDNNPGLSRAEDKDDYTTDLVVGADPDSPNRVANDGFSPAMMEGVTRLNPDRAPIPDVAQIVHRRWVDTSFAVPGGGLGLGELEGPNDGYEWFIERIVAQNAAGPLNVFLNNENDPSQLIFSGASPSSNTGMLPGLWIPENATLRFSSLSGGAAYTAIVKLLVAERKVAR